MDHIRNEISGFPEVHIYLDDIIIISNDRQRQEEILNGIFRILESYGITVNRMRGTSGPFVTTDMADNASQSPAPNTY